MSVPYPRFYENKSRKYVNRKRYRLGNPSHPNYTFYKEHGMIETLKHMDIIKEINDVSDVLMEIKGNVARINH